MQLYYQVLEGLRYNLMKAPSDPCNHQDEKSCSHNHVTHFGKTSLNAKTIELATRGERVSP